MTVERLTRIDELDALGEEWDALVAATPRASPFLRHDWLVPWWHEFGEGAELQVLCARGERGLEAALPLAVKRRAGVAVAGFLGGAYTELGDLLVAPATRPGTASAVVDAVDADVLHLLGLPDESALAQTLSPEPVRLAVRADAPRLSLARGWDAVYAAKLSSQRRKLHRKRMRQLENQGSVVLRVAREPRELASALDESFRLHDLRWRGLPDRSGFTTPAGRRFHAAALARLAERDAARIVLVELSGQAVASYYYIRIGTRACATSMAYDPAFGRWSPGWIATLHALETAAKEGVDDFEFLGGRESYKLVLADELAPLHEAFARPRTAAARVYMATRLGLMHARRKLKGVEPVRRAYFGLSAARQRVQRAAPAATDS